MYLCSLGSPVHFNTQVISISLPVQFAVNNIEEVADTDLLTGRQLHQSHSGWDIFVLRYPECYDVVTRRPWEVPVDTHKHTDSCQYLCKELCHNLKLAITSNWSSSTMKDSYLIPVILRLFLSSKPIDWKEQKNGFNVTCTLYRNTTTTTTSTTYWSLIDAQGVCGHPGKELPIMAPSENKYVPLY